MTCGEHQGELPVTPPCGSLRGSCQAGGVVLPGRQGNGQSSTQRWPHVWCLCCPAPMSATCRAKLGWQGLSPQGAEMLLDREADSRVQCEAPSSPSSYSKDGSLSSMEASLPGSQSLPALVSRRQNTACWRACRSSFSLSLVQSRCDCLHHHQHQLPARGLPSVHPVPPALSTACTTGWRHLSRLHVQPGTADLHRQAAPGSSQPLANLNPPELSPRCITACSRALVRLQKNEVVNSALLFRNNVSTFGCQTRHTRMYPRITRRGGHALSCANGIIQHMLLWGLLPFPSGPSSTRGV